MYKITALLYTLSLSFVIFSQEMQPITNTVDFEKNLKDAAEKIQSVESNFRQEKFMKVFSEKMVSTGMFYYRKPNKISLQYDKPMQYTVTINGDKLQTVTGGKKTTVNLGSNKMMAQMRGLIEASMIGNISALGKEYDLQYFQSDSEYFVRISPTSKAVKAYIKEIGITFDRQTMEVRRLRMAENNDDYTDYIFINSQYNTLQSDEKFTVR
ncbi:outer membrane lipoprotein carrier protein LolA [Proteiniphilum acetatigenes]|uniref:outer membrane lipoprotein carrier protein LolA n=1 Tax=Proteiniphilum acetatigenes TaxID=294710 RepID=UPI000364F4BF|nr:outer membrane lipoprotein carrier protein LolA [Proteiniphilum acetatigenes]SFK26999.1 Outer membrane lipoprotein-sorting protein [Porphyromonadaceae bacterium KH3CP3RA]